MTILIIHIMAELQTYQLKIISINFLLTFFQVAAQGFTLKLIPWDSPKSPFYQSNLTQTQRFHMMVMSSKTRAIKQGQSYPYNTLQSVAESQGLQYSINIKIGNPGKTATLLLDTGSGHIWTRCKKSIFGSGFNPKKSKTYKELPCDHPLCPKSKNCNCVKRRCVCRWRYGLEGNTNEVISVLSSDSFMIPMNNQSLMTFPNMVFGCSYRSHILSGILGLNKFPGSLISQVSNAAQGRYSYCLYERGGYLSFGNDIPQIGKDAKTTKLLHPQNSDLILDVTDISVAQKRLRLSPDLLSDGFLIDTGSPFTVLKEHAYDKVIQEFANYYKGRLEQVNRRPYNLHLCYKHNASMKSYASMTFHLKMVDYKTSSMFIIPTPGIMCIGVMSGDMSILGAMQQWNTRFIIDINKNVLTFAGENCSKDGK